MLFNKSSKHPKLCWSHCASLGTQFFPKDGGREKAFMLSLAANRQIKLLRLYFEALGKILKICTNLNKRVWSSPIYTPFFAFSIVIFPNLDFSAPGFTQPMNPLASSPTTKLLIFLKLLRDYCTDLQFRLVLD